MTQLGIDVDAVGDVPARPVADQPFPSAVEEAPAPKRDPYTELKRVVTERGLLVREPGRYAVHGVSSFALMVVVLAGIGLTRGSWWVLVWALPGAWLFGQLGFLGHDSAHNQVFNSKSKNYWMSLLLFNLALGGSRGWWADKHNMHHGQPNRLGFDPDTDFSVLAFTHDQALRAKGLPRQIMKHQANALWPMVSFEAISIHVHSIRFIFNRRLSNVGAEVGLLMVHYAVYVGGLIAWLGAAKGLTFALIHQLALGLYAGGAFLPNHIGMPMLEPDEEIDFLHRQILTARNISANRFTDYAFGGLSCQIEHHLFPTMSRSKLRKAAPIVRAFCDEHMIPYRETGVLTAYREVYRSMASTVAPLWRKASA